MLGADTGFAMLIDTHVSIDTSLQSLDILIIDIFDIISAEWALATDCLFLYHHNNLFKMGYHRRLFLQLGIEWSRARGRFGRAG